MFKMFRLVRRKDGISKEEFFRCWEEEHGRLLRDTTSISRHIAEYVQHRVEEIRIPDGSAGFDGIGEVTFHDREAFEAFLVEPLTPSLRDDESRFIDLDRVIVSFVTSKKII